MSCSSLTSCQHGHVRTLSSTDEHVFARLGWIHDPVCSVALPTAVIPFTFRACPRSAVCCRIKPYHFCIQPGPRPRSPPSPLGRPRLQRLHARLPRGARCPGAAAPRRPGGCSVRHPLRLPAGAGGRAHARAGGGWRGRHWRGRGGAVAAGLGPATVASAETATPQSSSRLQTRASRHAAGPGYTPGATARSCVKARQKRHISTTDEPSVPRGRIRLSGRGAALVVVPRRELGCVLGTGAARARY
jgi:hypothetical protein